MLKGRAADLGSALLYSFQIKIGQTDDVPPESLQGRDMGRHNAGRAADDCVAQVRIGLGWWHKDMVYLTPCPSLRKQRGATG